MVAVPDFNKFIVHCESALFSYPLELVIRASQGDALSKLGLDNSVERLAQEHGEVLFLKAGRLADRTLSKQLNYLLTHFLIAHRKTVVYASKNSKKVTSRVFELTHQGQSPQTPTDPRSSYQALGSVRLHMPSEGFNH
jgi:hypothetical protein